MVTRERVRRLLSAGPAVTAWSQTSWRCGLPGETEVDLAFDVGPFFGCSQPPHQFVKGRGVFGGELKPGQEVEGLCEVASVVQPPRDRREVFKPGGDVMGAVLEDPPAFVLRQIPPGLGLADRNQRGGCTTGVPSESPSTS